jgi:hypothetical protein
MFWHQCCYQDIDLSISRPIKLLGANSRMIHEMYVVHVIANECYDLIHFRNPPHRCHMFCLILHLWRAIRYVKSKILRACIFPSNTS